METLTLPRDVTAAVAGTQWEIDPAHSSIGFSIKHMMFATVRGRFGSFRGAIRFDRDRPDDAKVDVEIDATSIDTGIKKRDDHLRSADFFDAAVYPTISFRSTRVEPVHRFGRHSWLMVGNLTMSGVDEIGGVSRRTDRRAQQALRRGDRVHGDDEDQPQGLRHDVQPAHRRGRARRRRRSQDRHPRPGEQNPIVISRVPATPGADSGRRPGVSDMPRTAPTLFVQRSERKSNESSRHRRHRTDRIAGRDHPR